MSAVESQGSVPDKAVRQNDGRLMGLLQRSFRNYWKRADFERLRRKYPERDTDFLVRKLATRTARHAACLSVLVTTLMSTDLAISLVAVPILPASLVIAIAAATAEAALLLSYRLRLICGIAKAYGIYLDPDDPSDLLTVISLATGKLTATPLVKVTTAIGGNITKASLKDYAGRSTVQVVRAAARRLGIDIFSKSILKYILPIAGIAIALIWNYRSTKTISKTASAHFYGRHSQPTTRAA